MFYVPLRKPSNPRGPPSSESPDPTLRRFLPPLYILRSEVGHEFCRSRRGSDGEW